MFRLILLTIVMVLTAASKGVAQTCLGGTPPTCISIGGYIEQGSKDKGCVLNSDINGHLTQGRTFNPKAGKFADILDAAKFLKECMKEKGVYTEKNGTDQTHPQFESELARCNGLLYGENFIVSRKTYNGRDKLGQTQVDTLNKAVSNKCIAIVDFKIMGDPSGLGHAVEFTGASYSQGMVDIDVADPLDPDNINTLQYDPNKLEMASSPEHRKLLNLSDDYWLRLSGITLKCPESQTNIINKFINPADESTANFYNPYEQSLSAAIYTDNINLPSELQR